MNDIFLDSKRLVGDTDADDLIKITFSDLQAKGKFQTWLQDLQTNADLLSTTGVINNGPVIANALVLPVWADKKLMAQGAEFFARRADAIMNLLGLLSLPYCYAAAKGAMVLYLSKRMREDAEKRLNETAQFVWEVMAPNAFLPDGNGYAAILKVRLMHAVIRYYTIKSGEWNDDWGVPINQEDMAGTNLSFSLIVIRGLRKFGYSINPQEQKSFMHLWNVIGFLLGLHENLIPVDGKEAHMLDNKIKERQFRSSEQGKVLALSLVNFFYKVNDGKFYSNNEIKQLMQYLLDPAIAGLIGIECDHLSKSKIKLLHLQSFFSEFSLGGNNTSIYREAFLRFKQMNA